MTYHYTDPEGDQLSVLPTSRHDVPGLLFLNARLGHTAAVHVPVDQVEDLIAGIRDTARQSAAQTPDTITADAAIAELRTAVRTYLTAIAPRIAEMARTITHVAQAVQAAEDARRDEFVLVPVPDADTVADYLGSDQARQDSDQAARAIGEETARTRLAHDAGVRQAQTDFTSPLAGRIEVRQPCPYCGDHQMIPRTQFAEHLARLHPDEKWNTRP